jgi:hypothetical protein
MFSRRKQNGHDLVLQSGVREAHRRFGGLDLLAGLAGTLAAFGLTVLLGAATAAGVAVRHDQGARTSSLWVAGAIAAAAVLVVALYLGGWVAGRTARYDGTGNAWLSGLLFAGLVGGTAGAGHWADDRWGLLNGFQAPSWVSNPSRLAEAGIALVGIAAVLLAAGLGGALGARYHRRADALIATTQDSAAMRETNVKAVQSETVRGDADVDLDRSDGTMKRSRAKHAAH